MPLKKKLSTFLLLIFVCLEILCHTFWLKDGDTQMLSIIYFIVGLCIGILPLLKFGNFIETDSLSEKGQFFRNNLIKGISLIFLAILSVFIFQNAVEIFHKNPIDQKVADMLPVLETMAKRFLDGERIYELIPGIWGGMQPIYLPAMWLPFSLPVFLEMDVRLLTTLSLVASICLIIYTFLRKRTNRNYFGFLVFLPIILMVWGIFRIDPRVIIMSQEFLVVFYYLLLAYAVFTKKEILIAVALSLCLMSRFALVPWSAMFLIYAFFFDEKKRAVKIAAMTAGLSLLLLFCFQAFENLPVFFNLQSHYLSEVLANEWKYKTLINSNLGLAKFFEYQNLATLHRLHLGISFLIPGGLLLLFSKYKNRINIVFFAVCSLKICLVFFYNLLILPYLYLFYTNTFLSIFIFSMVNGSQEKNEL